MFVAPSGRILCSCQGDLSLTETCFPSSLTTIHYGFLQLTGHGICGRGVPGTPNVITRQLFLLLRYLGVSQLKKEGEACGQQSLDKHTLASL